MSMWERPDGQWPPYLTAALSTLRFINGPFKAKPSQDKLLTGGGEGGDLREEQVDVPLSVSHSCM